MLFDKAVKFGVMHTVPFAQSTHELVEVSVKVVEGLDGLGNHKVAFLGFAFDLEFGDFDADVVGPKVKFFGVFNKACLDGDFLHSRVYGLNLVGRCGFCGDAEFGLGLAGDGLAFKSEGVVAAGLKLRYQSGGFVGEFVGFDFCYGLGCCLWLFGVDLAGGDYAVFVESHNAEGKLDKDCFHRVSQPVSVTNVVFHTVC